MLRSMTGFGAAASEEGPYSLRVEIRTVNHRHLLVKTRLSGDLSHLEGEVERLVRKRLERGSVTVHVSAVRNKKSEAAAIDAEAARRYSQELTRLAEELNVTGGVSLDALLSLPGVINSANGLGVENQGQDRRVLKLVGEALGRLVEMREAEGEAIEAELKKHAAATARVLGRIEKRMPRVVKAHQEALERRVSELIDVKRLAEGDLVREVALLADRLDVTEEVARLKSHLDQLSAFLEKGGRIGRKLDFLVQEVFREINTIGSKCSDAQVAHWVVDAKTHSERLREQVQNVE